MDSTLKYSSGSAAVIFTTIYTANTSVQVRHLVLVLFVSCGEDGILD